MKPLVSISGILKQEIKVECMYANKLCRYHFLLLTVAILETYFTHPQHFIKLCDGKRVDPGGWQVEELTTLYVRPGVRSTPSSNLAKRCLSRICSVKEWT